ncbi:hypothetical protein [Candidatus Nitrosocosmicus sp. SS]|uniref:hypothetical protein n=1 Tax=Candidatus Nitrosocosmicus agrestis TaxID=2563600 RepID=UPI00122DE43E|nr:hypothetical protein [Candidatus Nitrosocosmicus sp. SS]KAA2283520.1 hypothetical protein F1Z66_01150 [Candidatus Nitrosocosmicus sp. SS]KAF0869600.1 hypothetical protein E5N71_03680 [Candidatus Nitrosocosmicus sp. SS]
MNNPEENKIDESIELNKIDKKSKTPPTESSSIKYDEWLKLGESIGDVITSKWNSQKKPGKVYVKNRRFHHGEVGTAMGIADAFKDSNPGITGLKSGIGKSLVKDDIADKDKWFTFRKKEEDKDEEK